MSKDSSNSQFKIFQDVASSIILTDDHNIPSELRFNKVRQMPIIRQTMGSDVYMFPSIQSYDAYKNNNKEFCLNEDGVGIPLFKFEVCKFTEYNPDNSSEKIRYKIYIYILKGILEPPPFDYECIIKSNDKFNIYKCLFCTISKKLKWFSIIYNMSIKESTEKVYYIIFKGLKLDVLMDDYIIRWNNTHSILRNIEFKARILPIETKSLFDSAKEFKTSTPYYNQALIKKKRDNTDNYVTEPQVYPFDTHGTKVLLTEPRKHFIGRYTTDVAGRFSNKVAIVYIGEYGSLNSFGIINIPFTTKLLACQALLLHRIEVTRRMKRRNNYTNYAIGMMW